METDCNSVESADLAHDIEFRHVAKWIRYSNHLQEVKSIIIYTGSTFLLKYLVKVFGIVLTPI